MTLPIVTLNPTATVANAPFSLGHTFKKGDVPPGSQVVAPFADFQCIPKNVWSDGSLKFAILAGRSNVTNTTPLGIQLSIGTPSGGTALTTTNLKATGVVASVDAGAFGSVSWANTDWDTPHETWVSGPKMSWFRYRKQIGTDAHLVAWLDVRVWSGGEVAVKSWVENGYWNVAAPTNKSATYTFTLGTQRYSGTLDIKHHTRVLLLSGTNLEHWLGTDPVVTPDVDRDYFTGTGLVPKYIADVTTTELAATIATTFVPHMIGGYIYDGDFMPSTGYQKAIGPLPEHDVGFLVCNNNRSLVWRSVVRNGYAVGRYPIHFRDELSATKAPPKFTTYSHMGVWDDDSIYGSGNANTKTPPNTGGVNARWELAHQPNVGYMAYLLTGDKYHLETAIFAANVSYFAVTPGLPEVSDSVRIYPVPGSNMQTRAVAWSIGALGRALSIMPDDDTVSRPEYITLLERIINRFHRIYLEQAHNNYGWIQPGESYDLINGGKTHSPWQMGFFTGSIGTVVSLDLPLSSAVKTKLNAFFQWNAKSIVTLLGPQSGFWYVNAAPYRLAISSAANPDYATGTGPWYTPSQSYAATYSVNQGFTPSTTEGILAAEFTSDNWGRGIFGNLQFPIAYAVQHNVPGAQEAYDRLINATNYSAIQSTFDNGSPIWAIAPVSIEEVETIMTTPGPSAVFDVNPLFGVNTAVFDTHHGLGIPLSAVPAAGADSVSVIRALMEAGDNPLSEARVVYSSTPVGFVANGDTGYSSPAGTISYEVFLDGASLGTATDTISDATPTVTSVVISPAAPSVLGGATQQFSAVVNGTNSPSQAVTWSKTGAGTLSASGLYTAPASTSSAQTATVTATSTLDGTKFDSEIVTIPATVVGPTPTVTSVVISPAAPSVLGGATQQFTAVVNGTNNPSQAVTWSKTGAGTLSASGLYTAPASTSSAQTATVTATSTFDGTKFDSEIVTIPATVVAPTPTVTSVVVSPGAPSVLGAATQQFTAVVNGTNSPSQAVTWSKTGVGTLSASGLYTAPASTSSAQTATVTATSNFDGTKFDTAEITIPAVAVAIYPPANTVLAGTQYGPTGTEYTGTLVPSGSGTGATAEEIAEAVWSHQVALSIPQFLGLK